jgi:hypothetical protein
MDLPKIFNSPLSCIDVTKILDIIHEESYIAACEIDSPNSAGFDSMRDKMKEDYINRFYGGLALAILKQSPNLLELGPSVKISVTYRVEVLAHKEWQVELTNNDFEVCKKFAIATRRDLIEAEFKRSNHDTKGPKV